MKKWSMLFCAVSIILVLFVACSTPYSAEENIELVAETLFTGPNDFIIEHYEEMRSIDAEKVDALTKEFQNLFPEVSAVCTESAMEDFVFPAASLQIMEAADGFTSTVKSAKAEIISEQNCTYTFTCSVLLEDENEELTVEVSGKMQLDDEGKISFIDTNDAVYALSEAMIKMM